MKRLRVLVLVHSTLVPPNSLEGSTPQEIDEWRTEFDVISQLRAAGHDVRPLGISDSLSELRAAILEWQPDIAFNLLEEFNGIVTYDQHVVAFLELMRQPYTGCNPRGMLLSRDKVLSKQLLTYHRIPTPQFMVFPRGRRPRVPRRLRFPLFVKSSTEDASLGIAHASVVEDPRQLAERIEFIHTQTHSDALVEEYVEGRELYVGVLGNDRLTVLPIWEMTFGTLPVNLPAIATRKVKWDRRYQQKYGISTAAAKDLPEATVQRLEQMTRRIFRALHLSGYARMDFRLREDGELFVLEANANPNLSASEDFAQSALSAGIAYADLLRRIVTLGANYPAAWRAEQV
ncbi:MAG: D-alanine--D-alanine ligase [Gammaproteobacteria bacterium]|nr:D-alanine--D-alanine ligase [Gammaproteobacteria bacterium]